MTARWARKPSFVGLFCGCGGFDLGFEQAGYRSVAAFDIDSQAVENFNRNLLGSARSCDLSVLHNLQLPTRPDVVIAGPPCQGFSTLGHRAEHDPRNSLLVRAATLAARCQPRVVLIENVLGAIAGVHHSYWIKARRILELNGFYTREFRIVGTDFGIPQIRRRVILLAARRELEDFEGPNNPTNATLATALKCIEHLPNHDPHLLRRGTDDYRVAKRIKSHQKLCNVRGGPRSVPTWDIPEVFGAVTSCERQLLTAVQRLRRQQRARTFGDADPVHLSALKEALGTDPKLHVRRLRSKGYLRQFGNCYDLAHTFNGKYRRLSWDHPAPTVDTRFGQPRYFLHPDEHRGLSVREAARIQGFPDDFVFSGSRSTQFRMIGNAVAPPIGQWFAQTILERLL